MGQFKAKYWWIEKPVTGLRELLRARGSEGEEMRNWRRERRVGKEGRGTYVYTGTSAGEMFFLQDKAANRQNNPYLVRKPLFFFNSSILRKHFFFFFFFLNFSVFISYFNRYLIHYGFFVSKWMFTLYTPDLFLSRLLPPPSNHLIHNFSKHLPLPTWACAKRNVTCNG